MVHFVGAGPGAVDLITVRGMKLLEKCDVCIYAGSLVNKKLLEYTNDTCKIYNSALMNFEEIIEVYRGFKDKDIVRLHTGDASLYGAIKEQMDELEKMDIEYEIIPGVSSFLAAAAALKIEYTLPEVSQSLIITRAEGKTKVPEKEKLNFMAAHNCTMVLFLSAGNFGKVKKELIEGGYDKNTPVAICYKVSWPEEKIIYTTLDSLEKKAAQENITKTALVIVGDVLKYDIKYMKSKLYSADFSTEFRKAIYE